MTLQTIFAQEDSLEVSGIGFPMQVDWLSHRFSAMGTETKKGLSLLSPNAAETNRDILSINYSARRVSETRTDDSGENLIFFEEHEDLYTFPARSVALEQYYSIKTKFNLRTSLQDICTKELSAEQEAVRTEKLELIGADIAGQRVSLRVSGNVNINGRLQNQQQSQVRTGYQAGSSTTFIVDQKQQLNIEGKIGDRISIFVDQDSERDFDFENALKIIYTGEEDDIVQKVEAGNVALSLPGTQFVTFSGKNNGLFGLKALMKLGAIDITTIASVEKGKKEKLSVDGGAQETVKTIKDYNYLQNLYFFLDKNFRSSFYDGFLDNDGKFIYDPNRVVADLEVYKSMTSEEAGSMYGFAHVDPNHTDQDTSMIEQRIFERLELDKDYIANLNLGFIRLSNQIQEEEVLAVVYRVVNANGTTLEEYGDWRSPDTTNIVLKLIKPRQNIPSHPCWDLEFKNIYYLGTSGINEDGFELSIVYIYGETGDEAIASDGVNFLQKFGLDLKDQSGSPTPDDVVDLDNPAIINLQSGELWFPFLRPFQYEENDASGEHNPNLSDLYSSSALYDSNRTQQSEITEDSKFKIQCKYENRSSIINLGAMVIENSEAVTLNGETLTRGIDYTIDYFSGTLTLLREDALNPDAELDVKYERNQFFQLDKKTILGARAQYDFGENSFIGGTALYFSQSVIDEKVDVGYEPMRNFVWDINGRVNKDLNFLTRAVDWLPLIETDKQSSISFEGEIAQVRPNPNTLSNEDTGDPNGVGFIDDFEGSKRITSPPIMPRYWAPSSVPLGKTDNERGFLFWYNPYGGVATTNIWPNKEVSTQAQNNLTEIMVLTLDPDWSINVGDGIASRQDAWGGITYSFPTSYYDQSKTKFLEIWVYGNSGRLHVDLGQISEDYIENGTLDTEDIPEAGFTLGNDLLDDDEDTGIDGFFDADEFIETSRYGTLFYGDSLLTKYNRKPQDPHSDNWKWNEGSSNYRYINGTEKSVKDASGNVPDSEDLNRNYALDTKNDYFTIDFSLDDKVDDEFVAGRTKFKNNRLTGWKLYRIPLSEFRKAQSDGSVSWQTIEACRIWIDGVAREDSVMLAKIEMVGNEWEELGIASGNDDEYVKNDEAFAITVINSEDNPDTYEAPKGVQGEYDAINEIQLKEQSLVMWFDGSFGIRPGERAAAKKVLLEEASFITYKKMKLFINGRNIHTRTKTYSEIEGEKTPLQFFIRFGRGGQNPQFYEYRGPVYPGWDERNHVEIDLDFMTSLKSYINEDDFVPDNDSPLKQYYIIYDDDGDILQRRWREVENGEYTGVEIIIWSNPAISRVQQLEIGVINPKYALNDYDESTPLPRYDNTVFGEIWLDELRLSGVRRNSGMAYRTNTALTVADFMKFSVGIDRKDADFHTVEQRPSLQPSGLNTTRNFSAHGSISLNKFAPASWGLQLPVSGSYSKKHSTPKFVPGTDILSGSNPADSILSLSETYGINTSYSKRASDFWLTKYTIDQLRLSANARWSISSSVTYAKQESQTYQGSISYKVPFGRDNYITPFKWTKDIPLIGEKLEEFRWYYTPSSLDLSMDANETKSTNIPRNGDAKYPYDFGLNRTIVGNYKFFDNLNLNYSRKMKNSLIDFRDDKMKALRELNPGIPINITEIYSATFSPKIFSWFSPSLSYSANYNWSEPAASSSISIDQLNNQNRISSSFSLNPTDILRAVYTPKSASKSSSRPSGPGRGGRFSRSGSSSETSKETESQKETKEIEILEQLYKILERIQPIQISYSTSQTVRNLGRVGTPSLAYRMGLTADPGLEIIAEETGSFPDNISTNSDASLRSGIKITDNINSSFTFSQNMSWSESQGNKSHNITRDFITFDNTGKEGIPFPSWTLSISRLEQISFLSGVFKKLSLDHGFSGKEAVVYRNGEIQSATYKTYFQPLAGLSMQFKNSLSSTLRMTMGKTITNRSNGGVNIVLDQNINASLNYQKRGGITIPLPFMEDKRLDNNITFTMTFDYSSSASEGKNSADEELAPLQENRNWKIEPRISYSFTQKVTGGIFYSYSESFNARTGKRITRNGGFDVNISIRG